MPHDWIAMGILWGQLIVGLPLNFYTFYRLFIKRTPASNFIISAPFKLLQQHLNVADLLMLLLFVPHEISLQFTNKIWYACSTLCRMSKFLNNFAFYACSKIIVSIAIERAISAYNLENVGHGESRLKSIRRTLGIAWALAAACAAPHLLLFSTV